MANIQENIKYPIIINKYIALKKIASRKEADRLLKRESIYVNGKLAEPGQMINSSDKVEVKGLAKLVYYIYNKPKGVITHSAQDGETEIMDLVKVKEKIAPIGRLDKASTGLILLTNDGRITEKLLSPDFWHEKEYEVLLDKIPNDDFFVKMSKGVRLDSGYLTRSCDIERLAVKKFSITLTEGKKHQIRRMCEALGFKVIGLRRVRIMNLEIGDLAIGEYRQLSDRELSDFMKLLKL